MDWISRSFLFFFRGPYLQRHKFCDWWPKNNLHIELNSYSQSAPICALSTNIFRMTSEPNHFRFALPSHRYSPAFHCCNTHPYGNTEEYSSSAIVKTSPQPNCFQFLFSVPECLLRLFFRWWSRERPRHWHVHEFGWCPRREKLSNFLCMLRTSSYKEDAMSY